LFIVRHYRTEQEDLYTRYKSKENTYAVITGSSDGLGAEYAFQLAKMGFNLVLVSRTKSKLEAVREKCLEINPNVVVRIVLADFSGNANPQFYDKLIKEIYEGGIDIGLAIINAGVMHNGNLDDVSISNMAMTIDINVYQFGMLTWHFTKKLAEREKNNGARSGLMWISSIAGWFCLPGTTVYSSSKAFVT
jgi:17beta-estradiol 17-dehydrogenase / very-long-chain 3-oxoacyl-CoA reductase